jgi:hypothetical protein
LARWQFIDPEVLSTEEIICADQDVDLAFKCLGMAVDGDGEYYAGFAKEPETLIRMAQRLPDRPHKLKNAYPYYELM